MGLLCISGLLRRVNRFRMGKHFGNGKGPCAVKLIMGPIISRRLSDIMSLLPSLSPWVFAPSLGGERGDSGLREAQSGQARAPVCPRPAARQGSTCCITLSYHGPFSPSALYSVPRPPTWPPIRITEVIFF